jgi:hypothetical protein
LVSLLFEDNSEGAYNNITVKDLKVCFVPNLTKPNPTFIGPTLPSKKVSSVRTLKRSESNKKIN